MKTSKIFVIAIAFIFLATSGSLFLNSNAQGTGNAEQTSVPIGSTTQSHVVNALSDPVLPSGFPPANFTNPQGYQSPAVPNTTPVVIPITAFGSVSIPNGTWETAILNVTGYDAGTAYDYFNSFNVNDATVWLGVNPEAGSWAVNVNISMFMSFFDGKTSISVSGSTLGLHQNFRGIQYNNYTLLLYPVPAGHTPPTYPSQVIKLGKGTNYVNIPTDTVAANVQSIVIDNEFQYTLNPAWAAYTWSVNGTKLADSFIYPWINSGGIDLFSWRPIYPPYMLNHQWNVVNLTDALGMIEGSHVPLQVNGASEGPGMGLFVGNLFLYTQNNVLGAKQLGYGFHEGKLVNVTQTTNGLVNENGNNYSLYDSYRSIFYGGASLIKTTQGSIRVSSSTSMNFTNLQSLPNSVWQNLSQDETTLTHTQTVYNEKGMHGVVMSTTSAVMPVSFDYGAILNYIKSSGDLSFFNYTSLFENVMEAYNISTFTVSNVNGHNSMDFASTSNMIYDTNGIFSSVLEFGPGFAIILNVTYTHHDTKKVFTSVNTELTHHGFTTTIWTHKMAALGTDPNLYYVQSTMYQNVITTNTYNHYPDFQGFNQDYSSVR